MSNPILKQTVVIGAGTEDLAAPDERRRPVSHDGGDYPSKPETLGRAALRWLIDSLALAGAGLYVGVWFDPSDISGNQTSRKDETSSR